jgi:AraC-like DNA-binding protein
MLSLAARPETPAARKKLSAGPRDGHMAACDTMTFSDPDGYAARFGKASLNLTITGAGAFTAQLTCLKLQQMEIYRSYERLPRIAYFLLSPEHISLSFSIGTVPHILNGFALQTGDIVLHGPGDRMHQRLHGDCSWGLISLSPELFATFGKASTGRHTPSLPENRILRPSRTEALRFRRLLGQACRLAETRKESIDCPEAANGLTQQILHAVVQCLACNEADDNPKTRRHHAAVMARFEEALSKRGDERIAMPALCEEIDVPERTLRMCCSEFLGVSPTRYLLLQRLNKARSALRRADPRMSSVAEVARNHQFLELGRFAVTYRATFGESPSVTLQRNPQP